MKLGPEAWTATPALIAALIDERNYSLVQPMRLSVRRQAARALGAIGPLARDAVPALADALTDPDAGTRRNAAFALGRIGPDAKAMKAKLAFCLSDEDENVRQEVVKSLALLDVP